MQQRLARSGVAHVERVPRHRGALLAEVLVDEGVDRLDADVGGDVAFLQLADELVDVDAVAHLDGDPRQIRVGAVHRVAELEGGDGVPAALLEHLARFGGALVEALELLGEVRLGEHLHRAGEVDRCLRHDELDAGVLLVGGAEHLLALVHLVDRVLLGDLHGCHQRVGLGVPQCDLLADLDRVGERLLGGQRDRDRPEEAVLGRHLVLVADALPVGVPHEAVERGEAADSHHDQVAGLAAGQRHRLEALRLLDLGGERRTFEQQRLQFLASMWRDELAHRVPPCGGSTHRISASRLLGGSTRRPGAGHSRPAGQT